MKLKKIISCLSALSLCVGGTSVTYVPEIGAAPINAMAAYGNEDMPEEIQEGIFTFFKYDDHVVLVGCDVPEDGNVVIPETVGGLPVTEIRNGVFQNDYYKKYNPIAVAMPDTIVKIGEYAFAYNDSLEYVRLSNNLKEIGVSAFERCSSLESLVLPDSLSFIDSNAFSGCENLSVTISKNVSRIRNSAFHGIKKLDVDDENKFFSAESSVLFNKDKSKLVEFYDITKVGEYSVPESVAVIAEAAFCGCTGLESIIVPDSVKEIYRQAFMGCTNLKSIKLSKSIKQISEEMFHGCSALTEIKIPDGVTTIQRFAFSGCYELESIDIPDSVIDIQEDWDAIFTSTKWYQNQPNGVVYAGKVAYNYKRDEESYEEAIEEITIKDGTVGIAGFFASKKVVIPSSVKYIGENGLLGAESFEVADGNDYCYVDNDVLFIDNGKTFFRYLGDKTITEYTVPDGVERISVNAFMGCSELEKINFPDSLINTSNGAFNGTKWEEENMDYENITDDIYIGNVLYRTLKFSERYDEEERPIYPEDDTLVVKEGTKGIADGAVAYQSFLKKIVLPDSLVYIGRDAFVDSWIEGELIIPENVEYIGANAFYGCQVDSIKIENPDCIIYDDSYTFSSCGVGSFRNDAFYGTIYGYENSTAQAYAEKYGCDFVSLGVKELNSSSEHKLGDLSGDGKVDASDASSVLVEYSILSTGGVSELTEEEKMAADVNKDGKIDASDASLILVFYSYLSTGGTETDMEKWMAV